jgi:hypothetical protein
LTLHNDPRLARPLAIKKKKPTTVFAFFKYFPKETLLSIEGLIHILPKHCM